VNRELVPSCWYGGDCCCVCGYDARNQVPAHRGEWVLEIYSRAYDGQAKAWWVPPQAIRGAWNLGVFYEAAELRERGGPLLTNVAGCACNLAPLTLKQGQLWRTKCVWPEESNDAEVTTKTQNHPVFVGSARAARSGGSAIQ
jgi:hypothetical protein